MIRIVSFSGGKDSTAMLLRMIELNYQIDEIVFCDTGVEFPEMYEHIKKVEKYIGREIIKTIPPKSFEFLMLEFKKRNGQIGYSWPDMQNRWCTQRLKKDEFKKVCTKLKRKYNDKKILEYHGIAIDEDHRAKRNNEKPIEYPLIDWRWKESDALQYCYDKGFDWGGLYEKLDRVSCWCCPLKNQKELRIIKKDYPKLWNTMSEWDKMTWRSFKVGFDFNKWGGK